MARKVLYIVLATAFLGTCVVQGDNTTTTTDTLAVSMPAACPLVTLDSNLTQSCGAACSTAGDLAPHVTQRSTLTVNFAGGLTIVGGSNTRSLQSAPVDDLTLLTEANTVPSWLTEKYDGFSYTPKFSSYASCGKTKTNCSFAFYAIDPSTVNTKGTQGKACRFTMVVSIDPMSFPNITSNQLYADFSGASLSASKAPLALLALLAVPVLFLVAL
uniref:Putative extracellular protein TR9_077 n=1 Tax=Trebouxia lynnae TaxID=1825957 RepID=A0A7L9QEN9_9CHLO|nr:putative extracellular protein TR9_077 [Trebouxia lynnae]